MRLGDLLQRVDHTVLAGSVDRDVHHLTQDSRRVQGGSVFVAVPGRRVDGHDFVAKMQAAAVVVERPVPASAGVTVIQVPSARVAMAQLASALHGDPSLDLPLVAFTGTNGKTTSCWMLEAIGRAAGLKVGVIGTTGNRIDGRELPAAYTTPEAPEWQGLLGQMRGCGLVAAEVSSIGLAAHRVDATRFRVAVYTNLSQDHLDWHGDMQAYAQAKARLFRDFQVGHAVLNAEDPACLGLAPLDMPTWTFGVEVGDVHLESLEQDLRGSRGRVVGPFGSLDLELSLLGRFNVLNALGAISAAAALGLPTRAIEEGIASLRAVPGRLEQVHVRPAVLVDYAHTPEALRTVLETLRPLVEGRLVVVFGCGGDRDRDKRPKMARAACELADLVIATSDNPRSEDPEAILVQVAQGLDEGSRVVVDRRRAIEVALGEAGPDDLVLIAGKGHETTQEVGGVKHPFDDRAVAREVLG